MVTLGVTREYWGSWDRKYMIDCKMMEAWFFFISLSESTTQKADFRGKKIGFNEDDTNSWT